MTATLIEVIAPVFIVIAAGYASVRLGYFSDSLIDGLMKFTQGFAIPCLLFRATWQMDLGADLDPGMMVAFYAGATLCFALGYLGARHIFRRRPGEAVSLGFGAFFSNSVLLGLAITERAYGADTLRFNFAIVAFHAPYCYLLGIIVMEAVRADGRSAAATARAVIRAMFQNALMIGILLGFAANLGGLRLPAAATDALDMIVTAALPAAIFGLGGVLTRYTITDKIPQAAMIGLISLFIHPGVTWWLGTAVFDLSDGALRAAVVTAAMAPGVNAYLFALQYKRGIGVNSTTVLLTTAASILTVPLWLTLLP